MQHILEDGVHLMSGIRIADIAIDSVAVSPGVYKQWWQDGKAWAKRSTSSDDFGPPPHAILHRGDSDTADRKIHQPIKSSYDRPYRYQNRAGSSLFNEIEKLINSPTEFGLHEHRIAPSFRSFSTR